MTQTDWRDLLDQNLYDMAIELAPVIDGVCIQLKSRLSDYEYAEIDSIPNKMKKVEKLVDSVRSRDLVVFNNFCDALEACGHHNLARKLRGIYDDSLEIDHR